MTVAEALTQYGNNADYDNDVDKAKLALQALRIINLNRAQASSLAGSSLNWAALDAEMAALTTFVKSELRNANGSFSRLRRAR